MPRAQACTLEKHRARGQTPPTSPTSHLPAPSCFSHTTNCTRLHFKASGGGHQSTRPSLLQPGSSTASPGTLELASTDPRGSLLAHAADMRILHAVDALAPMLGWCPLLLFASSHSPLSPCLHGAQLLLKLLQVSVGDKVLMCSWQTPGLLQTHLSLGLHCAAGSQPAQ